ncbi:MAG: IS110 family transposase [Pseudonocardiaceae bacterium]
MEQQAQQYVGFDLHRRRSVLVRKDTAGEVLETTQIDNDALALGEVIARAGEAPEVVLEACYGWYWAADVLDELGAKVHLAHPLGNNWGHRRVKNDERDASDLVDLLRLGRLAESYIAPPGLRELRELVRHRAKLVAIRSGLKAGVHSVLAKQGVAPFPVADTFGLGGRALLADVDLGDAYRLRVDSLLGLIDHLDAEVDRFAALVADVLGEHPGYRAVQAIPGVGPVLGSVFVAEIGDADRFAGPAQLCSWAGLTPRHRESDTHVTRGHITKQGSRLVRWAAVEAVGRQRGATLIAIHHHRVADRRGKGVGRVAAARKVLTLVYYGLRDGHIRCLAKAG